MQQTPQILSVKDVSFDYQNRIVLQDIDFSIEARDYVAIIGPNGGGKSTFIKLIMGLLPPRIGEIILFGKSPKEGRGQVGYLSQHSTFDLVYPISVLDLVLMGRLRGNPLRSYNDEDRHFAEEALQRTNTLGLKDRAFSELSGGERQRVLLARALVNSPQFLILDEPMTNVDPHAEWCFYEMLTELNQKMAILLISHDISIVSKTVKTIACLNQKMVYHGSKELMPKDVEATYCCHVDMIAHGIPHRVLKDHDR